MDAHPATDESASLPVWLPAEGAPLVRCGLYFDAIRVPRRLGEDVLAALGEHSGPLIESYPDLRLVWLVPPGTLCSHPPAYRVYGGGHHPATPQAADGKAAPITEKRAGECPTRPMKKTWTRF